MFLPSVVLFVLAFHSNYWDLNPDECHSISDLHFLTHKEIFNTFTQGANFFPLYKMLLKIIYDFSGYENFILYKIPSFAAGICSLFMFYKLSFRFFDNKYISLIAYIIFSLNYEIIYYSTQIKPYESDVLFSLIIIYGFVKLQETDFKSALNNKYKFLTIFFLLSFFVCFMSYFSIPVSIVFHSCMFFAIIKAIAKRDKNRLISYICFETAILSFNLYEYYSYVKLMVTDNGLNEMWKGDWFHFAPKSFEALNAVFNFVFFNFVWFDADTEKHFSNNFLIGVTVLYFLAAILSLKGKHKFFATAPFLTTLLLSFLGIYPFCNRLIVFLIPSFILIPLCIFDIKYTKYKIIPAIPAFLLLSVYINTVIQYHYISKLTHTDQHRKSDFEENIKPLYGAKEDKILFSIGNVCLSCNNNPNTYTNNVFDMNHPERKAFIKDITDGKNIVYFNYNAVDITEEFAEYMKEIIENNDFDCSYKYTNSDEYYYFKCIRKTK